MKDEQATEATVANPSSGTKRDAAGRFVVGSVRPLKTRLRRGAALGNLNSSKHPWNTFWRRRALRLEDRWILPVLSTYAASLVADRGGPETCTAGECHMIEVAKTARGCWMLILASAASAGGIVGVRRSASVKGDAGVVRRITDPDLASALARFLSIEVAALRAVGLDRRAKQVDPMLALQAAVERANEGADGSEAPE